MLRRINKIRNLGLVFPSYTWDSNLPLFKKFNLIYGWNGTGKTTLSRLFEAISGAPNEGLQYEVEDEQGSKYVQGDLYPIKIRIFNQDYIKKNVSVLEGRANAISILLGEENKDLLEKIEDDKKILYGDPASPTVPGKVSVHLNDIKEEKQKSAVRDRKFTDIAKTIGAAIGGNALRDYRKPQAEKDFGKLIKKAELTVSDLEVHLLSVKQISLPPIDPLDVNKLSIKLGGEVTEVEVGKALAVIEQEAAAILNKTVESEIISRLAENEDIANWVEEGISLHNKHASDVCEYCLQKVPGDRIEQLALHFNEADRNLKIKLNRLVENLKGLYQVIQSIQLPDRARFYAELQITFDTESSRYESAKQRILSEITQLTDTLDSKRTKTTEAVALHISIDTEEFDKCVSTVSSIISDHNTKTNDFLQIKNDAINNIKLHYLSTIFDEVKKLDSEIQSLKKTILALDNDIDKIQTRIAEYTALISSEHKACEVINNKLSVFLGHKELMFVPHKEERADNHGKEQGAIIGYNIMRGEEPALYLSEGEKTAIAFVYFVVHLGDQEFAVKDGIVVVDDPISSLDSNSLYQAFSVLKNAVKDAGQVFVLTHSFEFLKLLINWKKSVGGAGYYMIKNRFIGNQRCAYIDQMDKELYEYESEYHYLFKLLKKMQGEHDDSIAKAYPVPNIARKVWDTFLMFRVPNGKSSYRKMEELKREGYDEEKLDAIYKFTNQQSHITGAGFDPALVPETKKVVSELFEMMEASAPSHYKIIDSTTN